MAVWPGGTHSGQVPVPATTPDQRALTDVAACEAYRPGQRVWLFRGAWRPGVVLTVSSVALTVRYAPGAGRGTGVDTALPPDVADRDEPAAIVDAPASGNRPRR